MMQKSSGTKFEINFFSSYASFLFYILFLNINLIGSRSILSFTTNSDASDKSSTFLLNSPVSSSSPEIKNICANSLMTLTSNLEPVIYFSQFSILSVQHEKFEMGDEENWVFPGITYQMRLRIPPGVNELNLDYWTNSTDDFSHFSTSTSPNSAKNVYSRANKRRHQRKESYFVEIFPISTNYKFSYCSKNSAAILMNYTVFNDSSSLDFKNNDSSNLNVEFIYLKFKIFNKLPILSSSPIFSNLESTLTFRLRFKSIIVDESGAEKVYEQIKTLKILKECKLKLVISQPIKLRLTDFLTSDSSGVLCSIILTPPPHKSDFSILAHLNSMRIIGIRGLCPKRFLTFLPKNSKNTKYCGKIEDYALNERKIIFKNSPLVLNVNLPEGVKSHEEFELEFSLVPPCENVHLTSRSGSVFYSGVQNEEIKCEIVIHVPFGHKISTKITLRTLKKPSDDKNDKTAIKENMNDKNLKNSAVLDRENNAFLLNNDKYAPTSSADDAFRMKPNSNKNSEVVTSEEDDFLVKSTISSNFNLFTSSNEGDISFKNNSEQITDLENLNSNLFNKLKLLTSDRQSKFKIKRSVDYDETEAETISSVSYKPLRYSEEINAQNTESSDTCDKILASILITETIDNSEQTQVLNFCEKLTIANESESESGDIEQTKNMDSMSNKIKLSFSLSDSLALNIVYNSVPISKIVGNCEEGWVEVLNSGCVLLVEEKVSWEKGEESCLEKNAHLISIRNEVAQRKIEEIITNSGLFSKNEAYWTGGNDRESEGSFTWTTGTPFIYTNWFLEPNDDGMTGENCIEIRQHLQKTEFFSHQKSKNFKKSLGNNREPHFYWFEKNCEAENFYLCQKTSTHETESPCNQTFKLGQGPSEISSVQLTSPNYPNFYPHNKICTTILNSLPGHRIRIEFTEFHLEASEDCKYDYLEIFESAPDVNSSILGENDEKIKRKRLCGNENSRVKLLKYLGAENSKLELKFESDFSHHFSGYSARAWVEKVLPVLSYDEEVKKECREFQMEGFGSYCYLIVNFPTLNWNTARQVCSSLHSHLVSVTSREEWDFIKEVILRRETDKKSIYWLGGSIDSRNQLVWTDQMPFNFSAFHQSDLQSISEWKCLSFYWHEGKSPTLAWRLSNCNLAQSYICKKQSTVDFREDFNKSLSGTGGHLKSPNFPSSYFNNLNYVQKIISPPRTRIHIQFISLDIEEQEDCLYDYIQISDTKSGNFSKICGSIDKKDLDRFDFISSSNELEVKFVSDESGSFSGYEILWRSFDISSCISSQSPHILFSDSSTHKNLNSPHFPYFLPPDLNCTYTILAPANHRIWIQFDIFEIGLLSPFTSPNYKNCHQTDHVTLQLYSNLSSISPEIESTIYLCGNLTSYPHLISFLSNSPKIVLKIVSANGRTGRGFIANFKSYPNFISKSISVLAPVNNSFTLTSLNYPLMPPSYVNLTTELIAPTNYEILLRIYGKISKISHKCEENLSESFILIYDPYSGLNGTYFKICPYGKNGISLSELISASRNNSEVISESKNLRKIREIESDFLEEDSMITLSSTFNRLQLTQVYGEKNKKWEAQIETKLDAEFRSKILSSDDRLLLLHSCSPNPCTNGGICITDSSNRHICKCVLPFTGPFCGLSICELSPCLFGECVVEGGSFRCECYLGYSGSRCEKRTKPCDLNPCSSRGECTEMQNSTFKCTCHAFWEGSRCESRVVHIPFRPLSERMLKEPFWLGILTVSVVLGVLGLIWCLKRHFPEKLDKLLNDEAERNTRISWVSGRPVTSPSVRLGGGSSSYSGREIGLVSQPSIGGLSSPLLPQRSFLNKFGIRKPSLLSLSSATSVSIQANSPHAYENRTFSLDDLLRPSRTSMMRTPSPHRRRNFSIHARRDPVEKQQILSQLLSSSSTDGQHNAEVPKGPKPSIAQIIQMSEKRLRLASQASQSSMSGEGGPSMLTISIDRADVERNGENTRAETSFNLSPSTSLTPTSKAEKKVTFARLLEKLTATEMSSSSSCSDLSCAEEGVGTKMTVMHPKVAKKERKGRFRRSKAYRSRNSETEECVEMSSSDTTPDPIYPPRFPSRSICPSPTGLSVSANNSPSSKTTKSLPKMASADSLLALFRRFSGSSSAPPSPQYSENEESSAGGATPLSTPSSPRNSALSLNFRPPAVLITPDSSSTEPSDPHLPTSWRPSSSNTLSLDVPLRDYCLSPIHEVPTPLPTPSHSPAHSPMMGRGRGSNGGGANEGGRGFSQGSNGGQGCGGFGQGSNGGQGMSGFGQGSNGGQGLSGFAQPVTAGSNGGQGLGGCSQGLSRGQGEGGLGEGVRRGIVPMISISVEDEEGIVVEEIKAKDMMPDVVIQVGEYGEEKEESGLEQSRFNFDFHITSPIGSPKTKSKPPPLIFANEILSNRDDMNVIPIVNIEEATPTTDLEIIKIVPPDITAFTALISPTPWSLTSSNLPLILIQNESENECENDSDTTSFPKMSKKRLLEPNSSNLGFLSPFSFKRGERVESESNLSTSGYSSMASPVQSRSPSISPLCCGEGGSRRSSLGGISRKSSLTLTPRRSSLNATSPLASSFLSSLSYTYEETLLEQEVETESPLNIIEDDNEMSLLNEVPSREEYNFPKDSLLQVPRRNLPKSRSLDMNVNNIEQRGGDINLKLKKGNRGDSLDSQLNSCQLRASLELFLSTKNRVKNVDESDQSLGKSESELSGYGAFLNSKGTASAGFISPLTDSDSIYDCVSSEVVEQDQKSSLLPTSTYFSKTLQTPPEPLKKTVRKRGKRLLSQAEKKQSLKSSISFSGSTGLLLEAEIQNKISLEKDKLKRMKSSKLRKNGAFLGRSPKRRVRAQTNLDLTSTSSSSSHESLISQRSRRSGSSILSMNIEGSGGEIPESTTIDNEKSSEMIAKDEQISKELAESKKDETIIEIKKPKLTQGTKSEPVVFKLPKKKISRLRLISLQIRFLRRIELSLLRKKESLVSFTSSKELRRSVSILSSSSSCCSTCSCSSTSSQHSSESHSENDEDIQGPKPLCENI